MTLHLHLIACRINYGNHYSSFSSLLTSISTCCGPGSRKRFTSEINSFGNDDFRESRFSLVGITECVQRRLDFEMVPVGNHCALFVRSSHSVKIDCGSDNLALASSESLHYL